MKILHYFKRFEKEIQDLVFIKIKKKKFVFNIQDLFYDNLEMRDLKISIIIYTVNKINLNNSFKNHLINYLYQLDKDIHKKSSLVKYLLDKKINVKEIRATFLDKEDLVLFKKFNLNIYKIKSKQTTFKRILIPFLILYSFFNSVKAYNYIIKLFPSNKSRYNPSIKYYTLLRAKVENYEDIYLNKLEKSLDNTIINIEPYRSLNCITPRQKKYLNHLNINNRNYFFYIPKVNNYNLLKKAVKIYLSSIPNFFKYPLFMLIKNRDRIDVYITYLKRKFPDLQEFYINAEFRPESVYLSEKLKDINIKVLNLAHGLGPSSPIINFDIFYVFSKLQEKHYQGDTTFRFYKLNGPSREKVKYSEKKFALIFICYNFINSRNFNSVYQLVIDYVEQIAGEYDFPVYAKYHPDATKRDKILSEKIKIVEKLEDLPQEYKYLAISFVSTYVVELIFSMPFLIINPQNSQNLTLYCLPDNEINVVTNYQMLKEKIEKFLKEPKYYFEYWDKIVSIIKENYFLNIP